MWNDLLRTMRIRAIEDTDAEGRVLSQELRRAATQQASHANPKASTRVFLSTRSRILQELSRDNPGDHLSLPDIPSWLGMCGWLGAFVIGWFLAALGQESEINLLALPLIGILLWNAVVVVMSLFTMGDKASSSGLAAKMWDRLQARGEASKVRFFQLTKELWMKRFNRRLRVWFHIAAALLALGSISGMYARGWSKEYRAVWESTLLDSTGAQRFFGVLFLPASKASGVAIPLSALPKMQRGVEIKAAEAAPALPWIHLYAGTLALLIILPRSVLAAYEAFLSRRLIGQALRDEDWQQYASRLLALTDNAGASVQVLSHGFPADSSSRDRWRILAHAEWPDVGSCKFASISVGSEAAFVEEWTPPDDQRVLLVFNMASIPEQEIHRWLAESLLNKWRQTKDHPAFAIALDDSAIRQRWSGFADHESRLQQRRQVWMQALENLPVTRTSNTESAAHQS